MKRIQAVLACIVLYTDVWAGNHDSVLLLKQTIVTTHSTPASGVYHYEVFSRPDGSFGYDIFSGSKKMIHQDCIPGQPGNKGFTTKESAGKVAALVVSKIQHGIFPPTITTEELKQLRVL
jgi:hypothetical protein